MPMDNSKYPSDWKTISNRIRFERAGGKCEQCGASHNSYILRSKNDPARYIVYDTDKDEYYTPGGDNIRLRLSEFPDEFDTTFTRVILTVHHIGAPLPDGTPGNARDKMDARDENLIALCQRCHLLADLPHHIENRKATLARKRQQRIAATGQKSLFEEGA